MTYELDVSSAVDSQKGGTREGRRPLGDSVIRDCAAARGLCP